MARDFDRQILDLQAHTAELTDYTALGTPVIEPVGQLRSWKGEARTQALCATKPLIRD